MEKSIFRIISKAGFLLAAIGFFMPFSLNKNAFQVAGYLSLFIGSNNATANSLYALFLIFCIGGLLFTFLIMKKKINIIIDWIIIAIAGILMVIIILDISKILRYISTLDSILDMPIVKEKIIYNISSIPISLVDTLLYISSEVGKILNNGASHIFQFGAYMAIVGLIVSIGFNIAASIRLKNAKRNRRY